MTAEYVGDLHCTAVHVPSSRSLETDAPTDNQGRGESFSPTDLVGTALATCMLTTLAIRLKTVAPQLDVTGARAEMVKEMTRAGPRRIARLRTEIWLPLPRAADPEGHIERIVRSCPVMLSLHPEVDRPVVLHWRD
jgi:putative redox protein